MIFSFIILSSGSSGEGLLSLSRRDVISLILSASAISSSFWLCVIVLCESEYKFLKNSSKFSRSNASNSVSDEFLERFKLLNSFQLNALPFSMFLVKSRKCLFLHCLISLVYDFFIEKYFFSKVIAIGKFR